MSRSKTHETKILLTITLVLSALFVGSLGYMFNGGITGAQTVYNSTGTAQVAITAVASVVLINNTINFGSGYVYSNATYAILDSGINAVGNVTNGTWVALTDGNQSDFTLENDGNTDINLTIASLKDADTFIGGDASLNAYKYRGTNSDYLIGDGCKGVVNSTGLIVSGFNGLNTTYTEFTGSNGPQNLCHNLTYGTSSARYIEIDIQLQVPKDTPPGTKTDTITFIGTALNGDEII